MLRLLKELVSCGVDYYRGTQITTCSVYVEPIGGRPGKYRTQPNAAQALIDAAHELGYK